MSDFYTVTYWIDNFAASCGNPVINSSRLARKLGKSLLLAGSLAILRQFMLTNKPA